MVRIGLIGAGYWGPNLVRTLREINDVEVLVVADFRQGRREFIEKRFPGVVTTARPEDVLSNGDIDAVFIASPPETHCHLALLALEQRKHVFVEKPMATRTADAEAMVSASVRTGCTLAVGHLFLYHPAIMAMHKMLSDGLLGEPHFLTSTRSNLGPPYATTDVLWDLAPHDVSIALHLFGEVPSAVTARGASFTGSGLAEAAYTTLQFPSGRIAQINVGWLTPNKTRRLELVCSKKTVLYDDMEPVQKLQVFDAGVDNRASIKESDAVALAYGAGTVWSPALPNCEPLRMECEDFVRSIASGREPINCGKRALETVRVLEAAAASIQGSIQTPVGSGRLA